jgi:Acetyltransferase (GNAT) domain
VNPRTSFELDPLGDERWPELIKRHQSSSVFHSTAWLSALRSAYGYEPVVYTTCAPSAELTSGIVFCKVESWLTGRRLVSLPFSDHCDPLVKDSAEFDELLLSVRERVDGGKWDYCEVRPVRYQPGDSTMLGQSCEYYWHAIDLQPSIGDIFQSFHKNSVQRKIRRAERDGLAYEEGNSERLLGHFSKLLVATRRRQHLPPQPMKWFRSLIASFGASLKIRVALKNGLPIASILTLNYKNTVTYKYGCSDARWHPSGGMALLLWNTIQQAKAAGYEKLDLGRSDSNNEGLMAFKEHWGGIRSGLRYWRYPNRPLSHEYLGKKIIVGRIVEASPDRLLTAVGNLFYRHIA